MSHTIADTPFVADLAALARQVEAMPEGSERAASEARLERIRARSEAARAALSPSLRQRVVERLRDARE